MLSFERNVLEELIFVEDIGNSGFFVGFMVVCLWDKI